MSVIDYKQKYKELKLKLKEMADLAFRLGVEEGLRQSQVQQAQQAQQAAEQSAQIAAQQGMPGQPGQEQPPQEAQEQSPDGSELDQHIQHLEGMLQKNDLTSDSTISLRKALDGIKSFQGELKKKHVEKTIKSIGKAMGAVKPVFSIGKQATANMSPPAQKALNKQEELVKDIMSKWAEEEGQVKNTIDKTLGIEGVLKG